MSAFPVLYQADSTTTPTPRAGPRHPALGAGNPYRIAYRAQCLILLWPHRFELNPARKAGTPEALRYAAYTMRLAVEEIRTVRPGCCILWCEHRWAQSIAP